MEESEDDEGSADLEDVELQDPEENQEQEMKPLTPQELLKERGWEKLVTDRMKSLIDEHIIVLRQDYTEIKTK